VKYVALIALLLPAFALAQVPTEPKFQPARIRYSGGGDWYGNESSWINLLAGLTERTTLACAKKEATVSLKSNDIFHYPFVTLTGHGTVVFSDDEASRLRQYLTGGGFLWVDDDFGLDESIRAQLKKVFPDAQLVEIPADHAIFKSLYPFPEGLPKIHEHHGGAPKSYGIYHQGRLVVFYSHNTDIGDGLEDAEVHNDPPQKREAALKMGINVVMYALSH
jgi:hypothetical protein